MNTLEIELLCLRRMEVKVRAKYASYKKIAALFKATIKTNPSEYNIAVFRKYYIVAVELGDILGKNEATVKQEISNISDMGISLFNLAQDVGLDKFFIPKKEKKND